MLCKFILSVNKNHQKMGCQQSHGHSEIFKLKKPAHEEGRTHCGPWLKHPEDIKDWPKFPEAF